MRIFLMLINIFSHISFYSEHSFGVERVEHTFRVEKQCTPNIRTEIVLQFFTHESETINNSNVFHKQQFYYCKIKLMVVSCFL